MQTQIKTVKMFDYWAFLGDGRVQFTQIREGEISDHRIYERIEDAPIVLLGDRPELRYHGRSYVRSYLVSADHADKAGE